MARETNELMGHAADNDGIEEYDNPLPDWWLGMFGLSIVFAAVYPIWFHVLPGHTQAAAYDIEMANAAVLWPEVKQTDDIPMDADTISRGAETFANTCASCHQADLSGKIGPNLTDDEWIHGGKPTEIMATIKNGVSDKGMPAWGILGPAKIQELAAFIISKKGTAVSNSSAPKPKPVSTGPVDGEKIFMTNCAACHKPDLTGQVGPNLIDSEWLHGGSLDEVKHTITHGVVAKGMVAWGPILSEKEIDAVAKFVLSKGQK